MATFNLYSNIFSLVYSRSLSTSISQNTCFVGIKTVDSVNKPVNNLSVHVSVVDNLFRKYPSGITLCILHYELQDFIIFCRILHL
jgi:hypothetical protein